MHPYAALGVAIVAEVIATSAPKLSACSRMRSSSVATITRSMPCAARAAPQLRSQDAVSLTEQAKQLGQLQQSMSQSPVVVQQRVQALRKAINDGQYKVDPDKLAKAMATLEQDLFGDVEVESR